MLRPADLSNRRDRYQPAATSHMIAVQSAPPLEHDLFGPVEGKIEPNHGIVQIVIVQAGEIFGHQPFERCKCAADLVGHIILGGKLSDSLPGESWPGNP